MASAKPPAKKKFKPPTLIMKLPGGSPGGAPARSTPQENQRWTQSGAFVVPKNGSNEPVRVTHEGVVLRDKRVTGESELGSSLKLKNLETICTLGSGGSGKVSLVQDKETKVKYALKYVHLGPHTKNVLDHELRQLFVKHPRLVSTIQAFVAEEDQSLRLVLEYMDAGDVEELLKKCASRSVQIPEEIISVIARQVLGGLVQLHTRRMGTGGRVQMHRDLKPANILMNKNGECKVSDFGIAVEVATLGQSTLVGSPPYMSPERVQGARYSTPADIWAIGLIVAEMSLGRFPFGTRKNQVLQVLEQITAVPTVDLPNASQHLKDFVHALMHHSPDKRPQAGDALKHPFIQEHESTPISAVGDWMRSNSLNEDETQA